MKLINNEFDNSSYIFKNNTIKRDLLNIYYLSKTRMCRSGENK
jgi:hypothetical protein